MSGSTAGVTEPAEPCDDGTADPRADPAAEAGVDRRGARCIKAAIVASPGWLGLSLGLALGLAWALLPPGGSDLAAQVAHADFFGSHGWLPVDMSWFGGTDTLGYSILSPSLMSVLGVRVTGAVTMVVACGLLGLLLQRFHVPRPRAAIIAGSACLGANLMAGRVTFGLGVAVGLAVLLCLFIRGGSRVPLLVLGTALTWAVSPLAALFLAMVGAALLMSRRRADGWALVAAGGLTLLASAELGRPGVMPMAASDVVRGVVACAVVALVTRFSVVRVVAGLSALSLIAAYFVASPVGVNALRLPAIFAVPVALATSRLRLRAAIPVLAGVFILIPPMTLGDAYVGQPVDSAAYFAPLNRQLAARRLTGRVEVVPTSDRWEAVYVAGQFPLARGWMTQVDNANNEIFFAPALMTPARYEQWLHRNAVQYVAVSKAAPAAAGATEKALIDAGLSYLSRVWHSGDWTLYAVHHATTTVVGAELLAQDPQAISFRAAKAGDVTLRVQWSRWLTVAGPDACLAPDGRWTEVVIGAPGTYVVSSALLTDEQPASCDPS